jgi:hypothetical protein
VSDWKEMLAPTPDCLDLARLGEELGAAERAHVESCSRCQAELALFHEIAREETTDEEARAAEWIAAGLRRKNNVIAFRPRQWRVLQAIAAVLVLAIGAAFWLQSREPSIDTQVDGPALYRSARIEALAPAGELSQAPNELRWNAVPHASRYHVRIVEVDTTVVWSGDTTEPHVALPPAVITQFAPGKTLLWEVQAFRGKEMLASSETQTVRVSVAAPGKNR